MAYAIDRHHRQSVGHGMAALHHGPSLALSLLLLGSVATLVADGRGIDEQLRTGQGHHSGAFGIPLVPANLHAKAAYARVDGLEAEVTGREVEFLVVGRVVGDVHLAIFACDAAIALQNYGRIVVKARGATLKQGGDNHDAVLLGQGAEEVGRRTRDGFSQVEIVSAFHLTEIWCIVQFL